MTNLHQRFLQMKEEQQSSNVRGINGRVLVVDGLNTYIRCFAAVPTMNDEGDHVGGVSGFLKSVGLAVRTFKPSRVVIAFDGKGGSKRRRKLFPDYKENRRNMQRLNRTYDFKDKDDEAIAMKEQLLTLAHVLKCLPVVVLAPQNVEADDVMAYVAHLVEEREGKAIIMSTDKDFLQIVNENITVWNPIKKRVYQVDSVLEEYGIHPNNFAIYRAMDGDVSDNIPGVKGVGRKVLIRRFPQLANEAKVDIEGIINYAAQQEKGKLFESICNNRETIERNFQLMQLSTSIMQGTTHMDIIDRMDKSALSLNKADLTKLLAQHKMLGAFGNYDQWLQMTFAPLLRYTL
jgi:DNA polymerase-1